MVKKAGRKDFIYAYHILKEIVRPHRKMVVILSLLTIVVAGIEAVIPLMAGKVFDAIILIAENPLYAVQNIMFLLGLWFALKIIADAVNWRIILKTEELATKTNLEYVSDSFSKILLLPISFHKEQKQGSVMDIINRGSNFINNLIGNILVSMGPQLVTIVAVIIISFIKAPQLAIILLSSVLIFIILLLVSTKGLIEQHAEMNKAWGDAYGHASEILANIPEIKLVGAETHERKKMRHLYINKAGNLWLGIYKRWERLSLSQRILITITQLAVFIAAIFLVRAGSITPGELLAFNAYAAMLFGPFVTLGNRWQAINQGVVAITDAQHILSSPTETYLPHGAVKANKLRGDIEFKNVSFQYEEKKEILKNVTFSVKAGEIVAIVGESGVGKTTIVDLLTAFYYPAKGTIEIDGTDIRKYDLTAYRKKIGVVPQEVSLFNDTIETNIKYGSFSATKKEVQDAATKAHADEFIENFPQKYRQRVGWRGIKLSTGQKQRIGIARAILQNPNILILDEPTSALDALTEKFLQESLEHLMKGRTTFIIAHRLSTVRKADKILVLDKGTVAEQGTHEELVTRGGIYKNLYDLQIGLHE